MEIFFFQYKKIGNFLPKDCIFCCDFGNFVKPSPASGRFPGPPSQQPPYKPSSGLRSYRASLIKLSSIIVLLKILCNHLEFKDMNESH